MQEAKTLILGGGGGFNIGGDFSKRRDGSLNYGGGGSFSKAMTMALAEAIEKNRLVFETKLCLNIVNIKLTTIPICMYLNTCFYIELSLK